MLPANGTPGTCQQKASRAESTAAITPGTCLRRCSDIERCSLVDHTNDGVLSVVHLYSVDNL